MTKKWFWITFIMAGLALVALTFLMGGFESSVPPQGTTERRVFEKLVVLQSGDLVELTDGSVVMTERWKGGAMGLCASCGAESISFLSDQPSWAGSRLNGPRDIAKRHKRIVRMYNDDGSDNPMWTKLVKRYHKIIPAPTP